MRRIACYFLLFLGLPSVTFAQLPENLEFKHGISFFHDLKYPSNFSHLDYLNPDAPKGGNLTLPWGFSFDTFAPLAIGETGAPSGYHFLDEPLIVRGGDEFAAFYGRLADGIAVTEDRMAIIFRIHPDARWSDDFPVSAHDVVYTFEQNMAQPGAGYFFSFIDLVEALDDRHVAFRLNTPLTYDHVALIQYQGIMPEHYW
ncbi:MAG: hypothetical protein CMQ23_06825, partial [Gammaproteobacteria bacterium]|nr:hypothetical protein [Gammaproteobacteria bacterium]